MPKVIHFDIVVDNADRAQEFYAAVFDWKFTSWDGGPQKHWLITTGAEDEPGIDGGMSLRGEGMGAMNTIAVPSVDDYIAKIQAAGGKPLTPKMPIPGVGWFAACEDTEGNVFGIIDQDPSAG